MKKEFVTLTAGILIGATMLGSNSAAAGLLAERSAQPIYVDGQQVSMEAFSINGNNYVKLRDIGQAVGFNVYWDNGVQVDSDAPYTGVAPVARNESSEASIEITTNADDTRSEIVSLTNQLRQQHGLPTLREDALLMQAAQVRAEEMAAASAYSHTRPDGSKYNTVTDCPYTAENIDRIAQLYLDQQHKTLADAAVKFWTNSPGHLQNMLNDRVDAIGVGVAEGINATGQPAWYCVQLFLYGGYEITWVDEMQTH